jgi:PAS domain S-box-containing protein
MELLAVEGADPRLTAGLGAWVTDLQAELEALCHAERAARDRSEASFRLLIESSPDAIFVHNHNANLYANPAACAVLGYASEADLRGHTAAELIAPDDRAAVLVRVAMMEASGIMAEPRDTRFRRRDGSVVVLEVRSLPIVFDGAPAFLAVARDVSARREREAGHLEVEQMLSVSTLAAGAAHEINNPLTYVITNVSYVAEELRELRRATRDETVARHLDELGEALVESEEGLERVRLLVRDLGSFSRLGSERRTRLDLRRVLHTSVNLAANEIRRRARLTLALADVPDVVAGEGRLGQVFLNLLVNASHAIAEGRPADNEVRVATFVDPVGEVVVEVRDTGEGIAAELLPRIFDPFFTTKPAGVGTGLGLAICKRIVDGLGGHITVESRPRVGSVFQVHLPAADRVAVQTPGGIPAGA